MKRSSKKHFATASTVPEVNYRRCLCTYVDVLGFRDLVTQSAENGKIRDRIRFILDKFRSSYHSKPVPGDIVLTEPPLVVRNFSDLIIRIVPLSDKKLKNGSVLPLNLAEEILHEGIDLCGAQFSLLEEGVIVRGGMTVGDLYWEDNQVFGPALVRAYELEKGLAHYPRIVMDSELVQQLRQIPENLIFSWLNYFREDFDGLWFVDYLNFYVSMSAPNIIFNRKSFHKPFEKFRTFVVEQLEAQNRISERRVKYLWLAKYFNSTMDLSPKNSRVNWIDLKIPI